VAIVLSDLWFEASVYHVGILWPLYCLTFDLYLLFISSVSCGHCIVWPSICSFCLSRRYRLAIVLSDLRFVASIYLVGILKPLYCLTFDLFILFILSVSYGHCIVWPSICSFCLSRLYLVAILMFDLWFVASVYLVGILWPLYCLTFDLLLLFIPSVYCGHCIVWSSIWSFCLFRRYLLVIVLSDLRFVASVHLVGFFWPLYCMTFDLKLLFISSVSGGHCIVWPSICSFCLSRRFLLAIVLYDLRLVASIYHVGILWPLYCLTFDL
jgi:hypothetical protein